MVQPSLAVGYRAHEKLDVGVRASWGIAHLEGESSIWGLRNYNEWEGLDVSFATQTQDSFVPSFGVGMLYRPLSQIELGLNYRSASAIRSRGTGVAVPGSQVLIEGLDPLQPNTDAPFNCGDGSTIAGY